MAERTLKVTFEKEIHLSIDERQNVGGLIDEFVLLSENRRFDLIQGCFQASADERGRRLGRRRRRRRRRERGC